MSEEVALPLRKRALSSSAAGDAGLRLAPGWEGGLASAVRTRTPPGMGMTMTNEKKPVTIKKYANRRLYNTGASAYVTLDDLAEMVKHGEDFVVFDAKSGDDITRSVLAQIIFEQEGKTGQNLLPIRFLRQLIRFYGDSMQMFVPSYLEFSIERLTKDSQKFREQFEAAMSANPLAIPLWPRRRGRCSRRWRSRRARTWRCSMRRSTCSRPSAPRSASRQGRPAGQDRRRTQ